MHLSRWIAVAALGVLVAAVRPLSVETDSSDILTQSLGFSAKDRQAIDRGEVVAHSLAADGDEVALAAAAVLHVPRTYYLERFRAIETFKRGDEVLQVGRFSGAPAATDLGGLTLDGGDSSALRACRPGDCAVKLDAAGIAAMRTGDVQAAFRQHLASYAARYLREGNAALIAYDDRRTERLSEKIRRIADRSPYLQRDWPALGSAIKDFNGQLPAGLTHFVYWSKEKPPGKAIITLTHAVILPDAAGRTVIATKQLYASHYMTGSLGLTVLVDAGTATAPRTLLIYVNRTHLDLFDGVLGKLRRPIVRARARSGAEHMLGRLRDRLQAEWKAQK